MENYDVIVIGAGIYGLHAAFNEKFKEKKVLIIEKEKECLKEASFSNQARLHNGYHYPRSYETAKSSKDFFMKFYNEYDFAINKSFKSIYAIAKKNSKTSAKEFEEFCAKLNIKCIEIDKNKYFKENMIEKAYLTEEYVFDIDLIRDYYNEKIKKSKNITMEYNSYVCDVKNENGFYILKLNNGKQIKTKLVISCVYKNINYLNELFGQEPVSIKYELCEVELMKCSENLKDVAITIMDGPFFSIMPFGKKDIHTLTSVNFTPHKTSKSVLPKYSCQRKKIECKEKFIFDCNNCQYKPKASEKRFLDLYRKFMKDEYKYEYIESLYAVKPILKLSEEDDSRPTIIREYTSNPTYISCLSGKFSTVYLLDDYIEKNIKI